MATKILVDLVFKCFGYPGDDQTMYDEERQVWKVH